MNGVPLIDVRPEAEFAAGHAPGAASFPLEELARRVHDLPPPEVPLLVADAVCERARLAAELLRRRGHRVAIEALDPAGLSERGPAGARLWRPNPFLVEVLQRVERLAAEDPAAGGRPGRPRPRALDVACGTGRDAAFLAMHGYEVDALDRLPDALGRAADLATRCGVRVHTAVRDLEHDPALPRERYDLVTVFRFLSRGLFPALRDAVAPGGFVAYETFHERNRETGRRPARAEHLLATGELRRAFAGWGVLVEADEVEREGRYYSRLLARKPGSAG